MSFELFAAFCLEAPHSTSAMGEKRFFRSQAIRARREEAARAPQRGPSINERVDAFNRTLAEKADLNAIRSRADAATTSRAAADSVVFANLPDDVDPRAIESTLRRHIVDVLVRAGVGESAVLTLTVGQFGPCRPKTKRDRNRLHRGFAVCAFATEATAKLAHEILHRTMLVTESVKSPQRELLTRLEPNAREMDEAFVLGLVGDAPKLKQEAKKPPRAKWTMKELDNFPMRVNCLSTHTRFSDLPGLLRARFLEYLSKATNAVPELAGIVLAMEKTAPEYLRVKGAFATRFRVIDTRGI